jgi:hypothetical protein
MAKRNHIVWKNPFGKLMFGVSTLVVIFSILYVLELFPTIPLLNNTKKFVTGNKVKEIKIGDLFIYIFWVVVPPFFFLIEYLYFFPDQYKVDSEQLTDLKYTQELSAKVWAGLILVLSAILFLRYDFKL